MYTPGNSHSPGRFILPLDIGLYKACRSPVIQPDYIVLAYFIENRIVHVEVVDIHAKTGLYCMPAVYLLVPAKGTRKLTLITLISYIRFLDVVHHELTLVNVPVHLIKVV